MMNHMTFFSLNEELASGQQFVKAHGLLIDASDLVLGPGNDHSWRLNIRVAPLKSHR
jgi:hypothetical protein